MKTGLKNSQSLEKGSEGVLEFSNLSWRFQGNEAAYLEQVLASGFKAGADGAFSSRFESLFAKSYKQNFGIAFNSGTSTLHAIFLALGCGPGDEVLVPSLTPLMCGLTPFYTGATPVYVDVDADTFLMDPEDIKLKISERTKAILVVHMYGAVCDMQTIMDISQTHNIPVVEDCAQCHLGRAYDGSLAGTIGVAGSWSFENSKQLTCGDGGIVTTNNEDLALKIRKIGGLGFKTLSPGTGRVRIDRDKLQNPDWDRFDAIGYNFRMNQMAAAVALAQVERQEFFINLRISSGEGYREAIKNSSLLTAQQLIDGTRGTYYTFSAKFHGESHGITWFDFRKKYMEFGGDGIYAASKLLYQEPIFRELKVGTGVTPIAEGLQRSLMNFTTNQPNLSEIDRQCDIMLKTRKFFGDCN